MAIQIKGCPRPKRLSRIGVATRLLPSFFVRGSHRDGALLSYNYRFAAGVKDMI